MKHIHKKLMQKSRGYSKWHRTKGHNKVHWLILLIVGTSVLGLALQELGVVNLSFSDAASVSQPLFSRQQARSITGRHALSANTVTINSAAFGSGISAMQLTLPDGIVIDIQQKNIDRRNSGDLSYRGTIKGHADSEVYLTYKNGFLVGKIRNGQDLYAIKPLASGEHVIEKVDTTLFIEPDKPVVVSDTSSVFANRRQPTSITSAPVTMATPNNPAELDLAAVIAPAANSSVGGKAIMDAIIQSEVDIMNAAFANSGINARINLVHTQEVGRNSTGGELTDDLNWVRNNTSFIREQYGADLVTYVVPHVPVGQGARCGIAYMQGNSNRGVKFKDQAFSVVALSDFCRNNGIILAHEIGHNLGMDHNYEYRTNNVPGGLISNASYGYYVNGIFRTIMSYYSQSYCPSGCIAVSNYSNPIQNYQGHPTGNSSRNNAATANSTVMAMVDFRPTRIVVPPRAPSSLSATTASTSQINLSWTDNSNDEEGFKVERSIDGGANFQQLNTTSSNTTSYSDTGLTPGSTFHYRVKSYKGARDSEYSNTASASTPGECTRNSPTITIAPSSMSGPAGTIQVYSVSVSNNNTAACQDTVYSIESTVPVGWKNKLSSSRITLASGVSDSLNFTTMPNLSAAPGNYELSVRVVDIQSNELSHSATVNFTVEASEDVTPPTINVKSPRDGSTIPSTLPLRINISADDASGVSKIEVTFGKNSTLTCKGSSCNITVPTTQLIRGTMININVKATDGSPNANTKETNIRVKVQK